MLNRKPAASSHLTRFESDLYNTAARQGLSTAGFAIFCLLLGNMWWTSESAWVPAAAFYLAGYSTARCVRWTYLYHTFEPGPSIPPTVNDEGQETDITRHLKSMPLSEVPDNSLFTVGMQWASYRGIFRKLTDLETLAFSERPVARALWIETPCHKLELWDDDTTVFLVTSLPLIGYEPSAHM
jgi:hypothetical protein